VRKIVTRTLCLEVRGQTFSRSLLGLRLRGPHSRPSMDTLYSRTLDSCYYAAVIADLLRRGPLAMKSHGDQEIHIGAVIRNAVVFKPGTSHRDAMDAETLIETVARLFALLQERKIEYVLVGGIAMLQYVAGRNTEDIDLIMAVSSLKDLPEIQTSSQNADFARGKFEGLEIDLLLTSNPLFEQVKRYHRAARKFVEEEMPCATVEGLLLLKMYALPSLYCQGNFSRVGIYENDVATLIQGYHPDLESLFEELSRHLSETDLASVREIVAEIEQRIERFEKGSERR
jgi:hypothetical protein